MSNLVEFQNLTRLYGPVIGINDMTLTLPPGAYGLLGPNGAGKTTLLNLMTGQLRPTLGSIKVLGQQPRNNPTLLSRIGYLPGSEGLYPSVSAIGWVTYLAELQGYRGNEAAHRARHALDQVGMTRHMHRDIADYSRGMRQRTRLAQAILHEPDFLILDEPFNGLDPVARHAISSLLKKWIADGRSLFLASHVLHEIESITRSFLLINGGRLLASGSADDIHEMLADVPSEMRIRTNSPHQLAARMLQEDLVDSVRHYSDLTIEVTTHKALKLYEFLINLTSTEFITIAEVHSVDESLQEVFNSLMRIHRGEL